MDAEEFMMHGFDSDVPDDDNEPEKTQKVSLNEVSQGKSQKHKKYEWSYQSHCRLTLTIFDTGLFYIAF